MQKSWLSILFYCMLRISYNQRWQLVHLEMTDFFNVVASYKCCFREELRQYKMIKAICHSIRNNLWYLTAQLVVSGLFDYDLSHFEQEEMASKLINSPRPNATHARKPISPRDIMAGEAAPESQQFCRWKVGWYSTWRRMVNGCRMLYQSGRMMSSSCSCMYPWLKSNQQLCGAMH